MNSEPGCVASGAQGTHRCETAVPGVPCEQDWGEFGSRDRVASVHHKSHTIGELGTDPLVALSDPWTCIHKLPMFLISRYSKERLAIYQPTSMKFRSISPNCIHCSRVDRQAFVFACWSLFAWCQGFFLLHTRENENCTHLMIPVDPGQGRLRDSSTTRGQTPLAPWPGP